MSIMSKEEAYRRQNGVRIKICSARVQKDGPEALLIHAILYEKRGDVAFEDSDYIEASRCYAISESAFGSYGVIHAKSDGRPD